MQGFLTLVLHAHLPFVRHPEHETFLEEHWLFEAITECYLPLLRVMESWRRDEMPWRLTMTLTPTLCSMLLDPLLRERYRRHLEGLIELTEKELHRTYWEKELQKLAQHYYLEFQRLHQEWLHYNGDLIAAFRDLQNSGELEIITCAATHALLPLFADFPPTIKGQIFTARDHYRQCFGRDPVGIWLPECGYAAAVEPILREANIRWFILDTHGLLLSKPGPRYGTFSPVFTPSGLAAFARDHDSSRQVWSREEGYPGDAAYRDFYRDIAFDLDLDYIAPYLPAPGQRTFTGIKYHRITGRNRSKEVYDRESALQKADQHASHFLRERMVQLEEAAAIMGHPPLITAPYDAELFGHWWYEGPQFLDLFVRKLIFDQQKVVMTTPTEFLRSYPTQQVVEPCSSSWGEEGYYTVWLNQTNHWILPHLKIAQRRMHELVRKYPQAEGLTLRALNQAARELLLAEASDWPFILRSGTSPDYAKQRVKDHLLRFIALHEQLTTTRVDETWLSEIESKDNIFPTVNYQYWQ